MEEVDYRALGWSSPAVKGDQDLADRGGRRRPFATGPCRQSSDEAAIVHDVEIFKLENPGSIHANNSYASPTPVVEGDRVYIHFGGHGTACLATDGRIFWKTQALKYNHVHGPGGSPVIWKDLLIINCDGADVQYVVALDKRTGEIRWKRDRQHTSEPRRSGKLEVPMAYSTPLLIEVDGQTQLISLGSDLPIVAHNPRRRRKAAGGSRSSDIRTCPGPCTTRE